LRLLAGTDFLGFVAFFLIFMEITTQVFHFVKTSHTGLRKSLVMALSGAALGLLANAVFIDVFESSKIAFIFWILMGILVGMIKLKEENV